MAERVAPAGEMDAETLARHMMARHSEPFEPTGIARSIDFDPRDIRVWLAYHAREHSHGRSDDGHVHRGDPS